MIVSIHAYRHPHLNWNGNSAKFFKAAKVLSDCFLPMWKCDRSCNLIMSISIFYLLNLFHHSEKQIFSFWNIFHILLHWGTDFFLYSPFCLEHTVISAIVKKKTISSSRRISVLGFNAISCQSLARNWICEWQSKYRGLSWAIRKIKAYCNNIVRMGKDNVAIDW